VRETRNFFPEFNIRLYDKNSESDYYFFPPPKSEYFFQQHWESEYFFLEKTHTPRWKLNGPSLSWSVPGVFLFFKLLMSFCISSLEGGSVSISRSIGASGIIASSSGSFRLRTS
jgi:hypothetical protein